MQSDTRERILAGARDLFVEEGAKALTMRAVAERSDITAMAIYRHFDDRADLLRAVVAKGHDRFLTYLQRSMAEATPWARLEASGRQYLNFALENPRDYAILFMEPAAEGAPLRTERTWRDAATFRFLVDRIRDAAAAGLLGVSDPEEAALTVWAHVHGLVSLFLANKLYMDRATFEAKYFDSVAKLMTGFAQPAVPRGSRTARAG